MSEQSSQPSHYICASPSAGVELKSGKKLEAGLVVVGVGAIPNTEMFKGQLDLLEDKPGGVKVAPPPPLVAYLHGSCTIAPVGDMCTGILVSHDALLCELHVQSAACTVDSLAPLGSCHHVHIYGGSVVLPHAQTPVVQQPHVC